MLISTFPNEVESYLLSTINPNDSISSLKNGEHLFKCKRTKLCTHEEQLSQLFYLISGKVVLCKTDGNGKEVKLHELKEGSFFGLNALFNFYEARHSAIIKRNSLLLVIPIVKFRDVFTRWPNLKKQLIYQLIHQLDLTDLKLNS